MAWRNCGASLALVAEINQRWPGRDKASDGTIGDAAHATRTSDHNPWVVVNGTGVVRARDIDKDGIDAAWLAEYLRTLGARRDPRLYPGGYVIFNRRITTPDFSGWKAYTGTNPHTAHVHVSFSTVQAGFDSTAPWGIAAPTPTPTAPKGLFMALTADEEKDILEAARSVLFGQAGVRSAGRMATAISDLYTAVGGVNQRLDALAARPAAKVDTAPIVAAVIDAVARAGVAQQVLDGLAVRLSAKPA